MSDFIDYFTKPKFLGAYNANKEGSKEAGNKGFLYIEDDSDQSFWEKFINVFHPNKYSVHASSKNNQGVRGKRKLEELFHGANEKALIAVDSDYDYICPNYQYGNLFANNKYILHTFGFSKESVLLEKNYIQKFFDLTKYTISHDTDILKFINLFSELSFKGLLIFTNELNNSNFSITESSFHGCFNILNQELVNNDLDINLNVINLIEARLLNLFADIDYSDELIYSIEKYMNKIGIRKDNAYRYISGHTFHKLIIKMHEQFKNTLLALEIEKIKKEFSGKAQGERIDQLKKLFSQNFMINTYINCWNIDESDEIHKAILSRIANI